MVYKKCSMCGELLPSTLEYFPSDKSCKSGLRANCRECQRKRKREWNKNNRDRVKEIKIKSCKKHNPLYKTIDEIREDFKNKVIQYIKGYTLVEINSKHVIIKCNKCDTNKVISKSYMHEILNKNKPINCEHCIDIEKENSMKCICKQCGKEFIKTHGLQKYCSDECRNKYKLNINRINYSKRERDRYSKMKANGKIDWDITLDKLIKRDDCTCSICNKPIDMNDYVIDSNGYFIAGNNYPSIDHIKPISKGGTHTWDNIQLAHRRCNSSKQDKNIYVSNDNQLKFSI